MSGRKYSDYELDEKRRERDRLLSQVRNLLRDLGEVQQQLHKTMKNTSKGIQKKYRHEIKDVQGWLQQCQLVQEQYQRLSLSNSSTELSRAINHLQDLLSRGQKIQAQVQKGLGMAVERRRELNQRLLQLATEWESQKEWVKQWLGDAQGQLVQQALYSAKELLRADAFDEADAQLQTLEKVLNDAFQKAEQKEAEHLRQQQLREFLKIKREVDACACSLGQTLESASLGLQEIFAEEAQLARQWLQKVQNLKDLLSEVGEDSDTQTLQSTIRQLQALFMEGQQVTEKVEDAFVIRASKLRQQAETQVSEVESLFAGGHKVLELWLSDEEIQDLVARIQQLRKILKADRLQDIEKPYQALKTELKTKVKEVEEKESRHQRRLYLLKALRQVCSDLGFGEVEPPRYEQENKRDSRIILTVDTYNRGVITFFLSLETIESDSNISEQHCFEEFDQLSQQLKEKFGVQTKFHMANGEKLPRLIRKGEKEEPDSGGKVQSAQG